ncbi:B-cell receptor CD22-like isoform X1 [Gadus chalcogrammus]|uniref:B-cell receptor CD22-like isoform X1 n=3 Tax=Gadus chalcogrammus TaxID=1042646 RepID=UPI0024C4E023|nr:B-cell receptor CD22-like isoform X1 [Gadus chalcogrammus]
MNLRSEARGFLALLLSIPALHGDGDWSVTYSSSNVCALRGAMVYLRSYVQYQPTTDNTLWFTKVSNKQLVDLEHNADYTGRVESSCSEDRCTRSRCHGTCTLRINDLRQSDSAVYKVRFTTNQPGGEYTGDPGVTLSVTDLQVKVSFPYPTDPTRAELECHSMCDLASDTPYIWFRNGHNVGQGVKYRVYIQSGDCFSCAVEGSDLRSPSVYAPKTPSLTVSPSAEIGEGISVTLSCSSDANPAANYTWFKNNQPLLWETNQPHTFPSVRPEDGGTYLCHAENQYGHMSSHSLFFDVQYAPKTPSVTRFPTGEMEVGRSVTLSCSSDANPAANYTWFKEHQDSVKELGQNYTIINITSELGGNYYCQAHNAIGHHNSTFLLIKVISVLSETTIVAVTTIGVLLATLLLLVFWMRRKRASRKSCGQGERPDTVEEPLPGPVYENLSDLNNRMVPAAQREPIEVQDDLHYAIIHHSVSENQEVPRCWVGSRLQSDQTDAVFYSEVKN